MIKKLIVVILPVVALLGGAVAGDMMRPAPEAETAPADHADHAEAADPEHAKADDGHGGAADGKDAHGAAVEAAWFTFPSQFFVPLVRQGDMRAMMILTLVLETDSTSLDALTRQEHRLRDALLRQLMIHANTGGFDGNYTLDRNLAALREDLLKTVRTTTDVPLKAVLIQDIARHDG